MRGIRRELPGRRWQIAADLSAVTLSPTDGNARLTRRCCWALRPCARPSSALPGGANITHGAAVAAQFAGDQHHAPAALHRDRAFRPMKSTPCRMIRRQHGGAAVYCSLRPTTQCAGRDVPERRRRLSRRHRRAGMGLNLDVDHVALAPTATPTAISSAAQSVRFAQIAAARCATRDGAFGTTGAGALLGRTGECAGNHTDTSRCCGNSKLDFPRSGACRCRWRCRRGMRP
jgi:hypothetical protein